MTDSHSITVAVLGASDQPGRYSFKAVQMLLDRGHTVYPVTPRKISFASVPVFQSIAEVPQPLHTVTLYVNPTRLETLAEEIIAARPTRVIFNPGTEHPELKCRFEAAGISTIEACTLVLLGTNQFTGRS
jgi:predicted CoA-binding protein